MTRGAEEDLREFDVWLEIILFGFQEDEGNDISEVLAYYFWLLDFKVKI